jgi:uncharacterized Zn finger protein
MSQQDKVFGRKWWTQEWMILIAMLDTERLERAEEYATSGRVLNFQVRARSVTALVRGSRIKPYSVELRFTPWPQARLNLLYPRLRQVPGWKTFLKAAELPGGWRAGFDWADLRMIPDPDERMEAMCSCPDWSWPCKHALALCCLLAERMDDEPLLMLELQGFDQPSLMHAGTIPAETGEPLQASSFWAVSDLPELSLPPVAETETLLGALGAISGVSSKQRLQQALGPVYKQAAETVTRLWPPSA